ncbi:hypothetical protein C8Q75DRAFT_804301 [Abortiporus biennis]|nr:hypothetical protein C8Q75DRAFT_804301 [Abortiporus biennis]
MAARELQYPGTDNATASRTHSLLVPTTTSTSETEKRDINANNNGIGLLSTYYTQIVSNGNAFQQLSAQSATRGNEPAYKEELRSRVHDFHLDLLGVRAVLEQLGADKGLANYDRSDELETILKKIVNASKDLMGNIDANVYELPVIGSTLGPIVYDIKCILDDVLDATENISDGLLNAMKPVLQPVIDLATDILGRTPK